jgi:hypothetical protein
MSSSRPLCPTASQATPIVPDVARGLRATPSPVRSVVRAAAAMCALAGALGSMLGASVAHAQDLDLDDDGKKSRKPARELKQEVVREIVRGTYLKATAGSTIYFLNRSGIVRPGTTLELTVGHEFLDRDRLSVAAEFTFYQAIHNGLDWRDQGAAGLGPNQLIQGDIHTFAGLLGVEVSGYPVRRFGIGARLGGGIAGVPLILEPFAYDTEVVGTSQGAGAWGGPAFRPAVHQGPKAMIYVGPTFEYYTKLSHFSIGLDVNAIYIIGLDLGVSVTGYLKYTF